MAKGDGHRKEKKKPKKAKQHKKTEAKLPFFYAILIYSLSKILAYAEKLDNGK